MRANGTSWWRGFAGVLAVAGCFALQASAETETVDGVAWTYSVADGQASVGSGNWNGPAVSKSLAGTLTVPSVLGGLPVTAIGDYGFQWCTNLTEVVIPDSVTDIGVESFWECTSLTNVSIPCGVTNIGRMAFYGCAGLSSVVIPDGVKRIENSTFEFCGSLREVSIPPTVTYIGRESFAFCSNLTALAIPASVEWIAGGAFSRCNGLAALYVPEELESLEDITPQTELPEGCPIVRYDATGETQTSKSPVPVPHSWLALKAASALAASESDFEATARAKAGNGREMWECYVAGLDPIGWKDFTAAIAISNGVLQVSWDPDLNEGGKKVRSYVVEGTPTMTNDWGKTNAASRFFRVRVEMP